MGSKKNLCSLKVYNSLSRSAELFVPVDPAGRKVNWYSCGPTVYDSSHMGHARSYISFDILRRVFTNYFGYDVFYVMNITDIDDKIIKRARQEYLMAQFAEKARDLHQLSSDVTEALDAFATELLTVTDPDKKVMKERIFSNAKQLMSELESDIKNKPKDVEQHLEKLLKGAKDVLYDWLDMKFMADENRPTIPNEVFAKFTQKWEADYFTDMTALNILVPDVLTRVSEYVPEIVEYIQKIINNGFAYESNGSVYFDVQTYRNDSKHHYAKLVFEAVGDASALQEGEGELTVAKQGEKRNGADFALWKASKAGEPSWDSPWGKGRPGWHIECSAMASAIIGPELDIHTGGVDLKFPHHDNELAQSEAYYENDSWVKYFLHSGHLTIAGCKMSKSLKNFITIKQALEDYTSSQLRMTFLLHSWKDGLDYSSSGMQTAVQMEKSIQEFFLNVKVNTRSSSAFPKWTADDLSLQNSIETAKLSVHEALCDNIDTRSAMKALKELIGAGNIYMQNHPKDLNGPLLKTAARYITRILRIFGVISSQDEDTFGFTQTGSNGAVVNEEEIILPYLDVLSDFREKVRVTARSIENSTIKSSILKECDLLRDEKLPELGVRLEDREGCPTIVKYVGREAMLKEKELRERQEQDRNAEKLKQKEELLKLQQEKDAAKKIPPWELFKREGELHKYSQYDINGIPTHDAEGQPLPKSAVKKLQKLHQAQEKKYKDYLNTLTDSAPTPDSSTTSLNQNSNSP